MCSGKWASVASAATLRLPRCEKATPHEEALEEETPLEKERKAKDHQGTRRMNEEVILEMDPPSLEGTSQGSARNHSAESSPWIPDPQECKPNKMVVLSHKFGIDNWNKRMCFYCALPWALFSPLAF